MVLFVLVWHSVGGGAILCSVLQFLVLEPGLEYRKEAGAGLEHGHVYWPVSQGSDPVGETPCVNSCTNADEMVQRIRDAIYTRHAWPGCPNLSLFLHSC